MNIHYDEASDTVTICGIKYSGIFFRTMAIAEPGTWLRIEGRKDGVISVFNPGDTNARSFDLLTGKGSACVS